MSDVLFRELGLCDYLPIWERMRSFTDGRDEQTRDEVWLLQHNPVFTQGQGCSEVPSGHSEIPVVHSDRGGQITYHGPGQLIAYVLVDLRRLRTGVRSMVHMLEQSIMDYLADLSIPSDRKRGAPGVYVQGKKIGALGLRVRRGASYHGLSFNVDMDLSPFASIDPCGYRGLDVTQLRDLGATVRIEQVQHDIGQRIVRGLHELNRNQASSA